VPALHLGVDCSRSSDLPRSMCSRVDSRPPQPILFRTQNVDFDFFAEPEIFLSQFLSSAPPIIRFFTEFRGKPLGS
jgi:hypothetical protein